MVKISSLAKVRRSRHCSRLLLLKLMADLNTPTTWVTTSLKTSSNGKRPICSTTTINLSTTEDPNLMADLSLTEGLNSIKKRRWTSDSTKTLWSKTETTKAKWIFPIIMSKWEETFPSKASRSLSSSTSPTLISMGSLRTTWWRETSIWTRARI